MFLERARDALGHPIEIISGVEEARLIHLGVAHTTPNEGGHRLVVDIGGGSTELIIGEGLSAKRLESLYMGCVSISARFFPDGEISEKRMKRARTAAHLELEPVINRFRRCEWDIAYGASGTLRAVADTLQAREPVATQVARKLVEYLLSGAIEPGNRMPSERQLAEAFGVGRSAMREAIRSSMARLSAVSYSCWPGAVSESWTTCQALSSSVDTVWRSSAHEASNFSRPSFSSTPTTSS